MHSPGDGIGRGATDEGMSTRCVPHFLFLLGSGAVLALLAACSGGQDSTSSGRLPDSSQDGQAPLGDGGGSHRGDGSPDDEAGALPGDAGPQSYCPTASPNGSLYCQSFEGPAKRVGTWTLDGEPLLDDAGAAPQEDALQFWSAPSSRYLYSGAGTRMLSGTAAGPLPVKESTLRFRYRPSSAPYRDVGTYLAYVTLGDSTLSLVWIDLGRLDPINGTTKGYALVHHAFGTAQPKVWTVLATFPAQHVWSTVELTLRSTGTHSVAFDGVSAGQLNVAVSASTTAKFGFGPYYSSSSSADNPTYMTGNVDDVVALIAR